MHCPHPPAYPPTGTAAPPAQPTTQKGLVSARSGQYLRCGMEESIGRKGGMQRTWPAAFLVRPGLTGGVHAVQQWYGRAEQVGEGRARGHNQAAPLHVRSGVGRGGAWPERAGARGGAQARGLEGTVGVAGVVGKEGRKEPESDKTFPGSAETSIPMVLRKQKAPNDFTH
jgi:hypothetical protein